MFQIRLLFLSYLYIYIYIFLFFFCVAIEWSSNAQASCSTASGAFQGSDENVEKKGKEPRSQDYQISSARKCILFSGYIHFQVAGVEATWFPQMFDGLSCVVCEFGVEWSPMSALSIPKVALPQRLGTQRLQ